MLTREKASGIAPREYRNMRTGTEAAYKQNGRDQMTYAEALKHPR